MKRYFYIIHRDGQIFEIDYTEERFKSSFDQWQKGGLVIFPNLGVGLNTVDITKILDEGQYDSYIDSTNPKTYIKDGTWRDGKERKVIRHEKWKEEQIENQRKQSLPAPEEKELTHEQITANFKKYRPQFMKDRDELIEKWKVK